MSPLDPHDDDLFRLLSDAVDDIEPRPGIQAIRSRTATTKESSMFTNRTWVLGVVGAAAATAAVIAGVSVLSNPDADQDPGPSKTPTGQVSEPPDTTGSPEPEPTQTAATVAAPVYFVGDTPRGPRLYREFQRVDSADRLLAAANASAAGEAADADYRSLWPEGAAFKSVSFDGTGSDGLITVVLVDESLHDRPAGTTEAEASLAIEQIIFTLQGAVGARAPVQFKLGNNPIDTVLGVPTSEPLANAPVTDVLALMNITTPEEGASVSGVFEANGVHNGFEGTVACSIRDGERKLWEEPTIGGWGEGKLFPWKLAVDTSGIPAGTYTFFCTNDDPSGGAEGGGPHTDTKTITIE